MMMMMIHNDDNDYTLKTCDYTLKTCTLHNNSTLHNNYTLSNK